MEKPFGVMLIIGVILYFAIGAIVGWLGTMIYKRSPLGLSGNIIAGIVGSMIGSTLLGVLKINLGTGLIGAILQGVIGAIVILFLLNLIFKNK